LRESEVISTFLRYLKRQGDLPLGDDAGAIKLRDRWLVATNDMLVGKTDVPGIMTPRQVGFKAVTMNLSDVAAMGARPIGFLFSLGITSDLDSDYIEGIAKGIGEALDFYKVPVLSADTNEADDLVIDGMAIGTTKRLLPRSGAKPGDLVCVTGDLGRALAGYLVWRDDLEVGGRVKDALYERFLEPKARVEEGVVLSAVASSAIDVSDGLAKELNILSERSGVKICVDAWKLPVREEVIRVSEILGLDVHKLALASGEEFEILFTLPEDLLEGLTFDCTVIGRVFEGNGVYLMDRGRAEKLPPLGWEHMVPRGSWY